MPRMVTFEDRVWTISAQPRVKGTLAKGERDVPSQIGGLWFRSDQGDTYFLPLDTRQVLTDQGLHALSLDRVADFLKRAMREQPPNRGGEERRKNPVA